VGDLRRQVALLLGATYSWIKSDGAQLGKGVKTYCRRGTGARISSSVQSP